VPEVGHFFGTQHDQQLFGPLRVDQIIEGEIAPLQGFLVEKTQSPHTDLDSARGEFLFVEQTQLVTAYLLGTCFFGDLPKYSANCFTARI
jgi:hypothetical protein